MIDLEAKLKAESDEWFAKVEKLLGAVPDPEEDWAELWFDGYTPEEAVADMTGAPVGSPTGGGHD
jgi:hypothetical protein